MSSDLSKARMFEGGEEESPWKFISFALVSEDNTEGEDIIKVWLYELLPFEEGEIKEIKIKEDQELLDMNGVKKKVTIDRKAQIEARWYPTVDGRQTPPNVVEGETVEIYKYGHEDVYRWVSNGRQTELRRLEHVTYAYSNLKDGREPFDGKSSYGWTYSTREKFVRVWTRKSDGEAFEYQWFIDTKNNTMKFHDDIGNIFGFHSDTVDVYLRNSANSYARALQSEFIVNAAARVLLQAPLTQITDALEIGAVLRVPLIIADTIRANMVISALTPKPSGGSPSVSPMAGIDFVEDFTIGSFSGGESGGSEAKDAVEPPELDPVETPVDFEKMEQEKEETKERVTELEDKVTQLTEQLRILSDRFNAVQP